MKMHYQSDKRDPLLVYSMRERLEMVRKVLADAGKVIANLEAENAALRRQIAEMESAPR